jgi:tetraacyldisaccharide 4'-kinase
MRSGIETMWYGRKAPLWLVPFSLLYGFVMSVRGLFYRLGLRHRIKVAVPVVVVGNLTVGGTGKTPLVAWLSSHLAACGMRVAIVSRGYGGRARGVTRVTVHSRASEVGDEPLLLARRAAARCSSARIAWRRRRPPSRTAPTSWSATMDCSTWRWCANVRSW